MNTLPKNMRAAVYHRQGELSIETCKIPEVGRNDVLLRVSYCGVCGTDLHLVMDGWGQPESIFGHEYSGQIVAMGEGVQAWVLGQSVVALPSPSCGECKFCLQHRPSLCINDTDIGSGSYQGAFAEYKAVAAKDIIAIPDGLNLRDAALCEPLAVAMHGITRSAVVPGMRVLISGCGPIGLLILAVLKSTGIDDIVVCEPSTERRQHAVTVGAAHVLQPKDMSIPEIPTEQVAAPFDVAFECSGKSAAIETALGNLDKGGVLVLMGTGLDPTNLDAIRIILSEIVITGAYNYDELGFQTALDLLASGKLKSEDLIVANDTVLGDLLPSMQALAAGDMVGKLMVDVRH